MSGKGVVDGDATAIVEFFFLGLLLVYYVANGGVLSPITNATVISNYQLAYNNMKWFLYILIPIFPFVLLKGWGELSDRMDKEIDDE